MYEGLLPIGTVVSLTNSTKLVMIAGYCPTGTARPGYVWDYSGFPYPDGYMDNEHILQFDKEQITEVMAMGYQDSEQFSFKVKLDGAIDSIKGREG